MTRALLAAIAVASIVIVAAAPAFAAACSEADVRVMQKEGLNKSAIDRICTSASAKAPAESAAGKGVSNRCQTIITTCFIGQSAPVGAACWCASPGGPVTGRVQP